MKTWNWIGMALLTLALSLSACGGGDDDDNGETTYCEEPGTCDDGDPCTLNVCDPETGECSFPANTCDDGNACTTDSCDADTGECLNVAKTCDDGDLCTKDLCLSESGECLNDPLHCDDGDACTVDSCSAETGECVFDATVTCDDGDACTTDSCNAMTGECEFVGTQCDDNDPCTVDSCDAATGDCVYVVGNDGAECDDMAPETFDDMCDNGDCIGVYPEAYRIHTIALDTPTIEVAGEALNGVIGEALVEELENWDFVVLFGGDWSIENGLTVEFGEGQCDDASPASCGWKEEGRTARFETVSHSANGTCPGMDAADLPCFSTPTATFNLSDIVPDKVLPGLPAVEGQAWGWFHPDGTLEGVVEGFLPKVVAEGVVLPLGVEDVTAADIINATETEEYGGQEGWWLRFSFAADWTLADFQI